MRCVRMFVPQRRHYLIRAVSIICKRSDLNLPNCGRNGYTSVSHLPALEPNVTSLRLGKNFCLRLKSIAKEKAPAYRAYRRGCRIALPILRTWPIPQSIRELSKHDWPTRSPSLASPRASCVNDRIRRITQTRRHCCDVQSLEWWADALNPVARSPVLPPAFFICRKAQTLRQSHRVESQACDTNVLLEAERNSTRFQTSFRLTVRPKKLF